MRLKKEEITKQKRERLGERKLMNCGHMATIVDMRRCDDIDVQFDDKTIVTNRTYDAFKKGTIKNPNIQSPHVGETNIMSNGMKATIVKYEGYKRITLEFENGIIRENVDYSAFKSGKVNPVYRGDRMRKAAKERLYETRMMNCGLECTIIEYFCSHNITVRFTDGTICKKRKYKEFCSGSISNYDCMKCLHETRTMSNGQLATIVAVRTHHDLDVQFEDGTIVTNKTYREFTLGSIRNPNYRQHLNEKQRMRNGLMATIVADRKWDDIDVEFEDGTVIKNVYYKDFKEGAVVHPNYKPSIRMSLQEFSLVYYLEKLGFKKIEQGEWVDRGFGLLELDFYHDGKKIAIELDGAVHDRAADCTERELRKKC